MKKPATGQRRRKKRPTMRFRLDGQWWTVKVQRPPDKERLICCVVRWLANEFNDGKISIGRHRVDR